MSQPTVSSPSPRRIDGLDGLRAVAVALVVLFHAGWVHNGYVGVDIFFVLSGFLITSILRREYQGTKQIKFGRFYLRRIIRLYPALLVMVVAFVMLAFIFHRHVRDVALGGLASLLYYANIWEYTPGHETVFFDHTWTLALEQQFYLVWPLLFVLIKRRRFGGALALAALVAVIVSDKAAGSAALHTYVRAAGLPLGCALAFAPGQSKLLHWFRHLAWPGIVAILALAFIPVNIGAWLAGWPFGVVGPLTVPVVAALVQPGRLTRMLSVWPLIWLGTRSYSLYLWHLPILSILINNTDGPLPVTVRATIGIGASLVAADLSFRYVEQPFLRWRARSRSLASVAEPRNVA